jgi:hypothetical protein
MNEKKNVETTKRARLTIEVPTKIRGGADTCQSRCSSCQSRCSTCTCRRVYKAM